MPERTNELSDPEQLAEPTPSDIAQRLTDDTRALRERYEDCAVPLTDDQRNELVLLAKAAMDLFDGG